MLHADPAAPRPPAPSDTPAPDPPHLGRLRSVSRLLDDLAAVPGTRMRVGIDPVLGLVPGLGDAVTGSVAAYAIFVAQRLGAPASVLVRMAWNVLVDVLVGTVPFVGDLFDFGWKASRKNVRLVERYVAEPGEVTASSRVVALLMILLLAAGIVGMAWLALALVGVLRDHVTLWPTSAAPAAPTP